MPIEIMIIEIMQIAMTGIMVIVLGIPVIRPIARRVDQPRAPASLGVMEQQ